MRVSFSEKKFNEEFEARILKRFPSLKSAIAAYPDRYRLELRAARWGYEEGTLEKLQNAKMLFKRGYAQGKKDFKEDKKARDAKIREDLELLEFYLAYTHGKKCSAWTLDVPPMLLKKVKKMKLLLVVKEAKTK